MREVYEQVGTNTSLMSFGLLLIALVVLASAFVQGFRNSEKRAPKGCVYTLIASAVAFGVLAALRVPDHLLIIWLPIGVAAAAIAWVIAAKDFPRGLRWGCAALLLLMALPFWGQGMLLFGRSRASIVLTDKELIYESDQRTASMDRSQVSLRVVPVSASKHVLEIRDATQTVPISSRFLFRDARGSSLDVDELQIRVQRWLDSKSN